MTEIDSWVLYPDLRDRVIALARSLSLDDLGRTVPITPGWTVAQVVAHVCGLNADIVAGGREDLGSDERTTAQVSSRNSMTINTVCDEWLEYDDAMRAIVAEVPLFEQRLAADLLVHLHDIEHALGREISSDDHATISAAHVYALRTPDRWAELAGVSVAIELSDGFRSGPDDAEVRLRATPFDFLRSVSGRRSRRQVEALEWTGPAGPVLDHFSPYSSLGEEDAPI